MAQLLLGGSSSGGGGGGSCCRVVLLCGVLGVVHEVDLNDAAFAAHLEPAKYGGGGGGKVWDVGDVWDARCNSKEGDGSSPYSHAAVHIAPPPH